MKISAATETVDPTGEDRWKKINPDGKFYHVIPTSKISVYYHITIKHLGFPPIFDDEIPQIWDTFAVALSGGKANGELHGGGAGEGGAPWLIKLVYTSNTNGLWYL